MKKCAHCGKEVADNMKLCTYCGQNVEGEDKPDLGLNLISLFVPLVGLVLYLLFRQKAPIKAKSIGKFALAGVVLQLVVSAITVGYGIWQYITFFD